MTTTIPTTILYQQPAQQQKQQQQSTNKSYTNPSYLCNICHKTLLSNQCIITLCKHLFCINCATRYFSNLPAQCMYTMKHKSYYETLYAALQVLLTNLIYFVIY